MIIQGKFQGVGPSLGELKEATRDAWQLQGGEAQLLLKETIFAQANVQS
jgi:hypothetical protein